MPVLDLSGLMIPKFQPLIYDRSRWIVLWGGAGSGKSFSAHQIAVIMAMNAPTDRPERIYITRKVARTLRTSVWALLIGIIGEWGLAAHFHTQQQEMVLTYKPNGSKIICVGMDDPEKKKSIYKPTKFFHEECTELEARDVRQCNLRMRGEGVTDYYQNWMMFNPVSQHHWIKKEYFDNPPASCTTVHSTYQDNPFLDDAYREELERLREVDPEWFEIYGLGNWGVLEGLIYKAWPLASLSQLAVPVDVMRYGVDFGFNNPSAVVQVDERDRDLFLTEHIYERGLTTPQLIERMEELELDKSADMWADAENPDAIEQLANAGYNVHPAHKGRGSVAEGIKHLKSRKVYLMPGATNIERERSMYRWAKDRLGNTLEVPYKHDDHGMDAVRYAVWSAEVEESRGGGIVC